jgi:hypothetical protein
MAGCVAQWMSNSHAQFGLSLLDGMVPNLSFLETSFIGPRAWEIEVLVGE